MASSEEKLKSLHWAIQRCQKCLLHESRDHAVPGTGPVSAGVMIIGEAPGEAEDQNGLPFQGRAGEHLNQLLTDAGLKRAEVYVTNSVKCRPPDNRTPRSEELRICRESWLEKQVELVDPSLVVLLGRTAVKQVLQQDVKLRESHGRIVKSQGRRFLITFHPAAGMRFPEAGQAMKADFQKVKRWTTAGG